MRFSPERVLWRPALSAPFRNAVTYDLVRSLLRKGLFRALHRNIAVRHSETVLRYTVSEPCPRPLTYGKNVTEIRDAQKGRKVRPSLRLVVGLNRAADCVTARASNECVGGAYACGFCRFRKRRHSRRRTRGHLVRWKEKDICPQVFAIFPAITKKKTGKPSPFCYGGVE